MIDKAKIVVQEISGQLKIGLGGIFLGGRIGFGLTDLRVKSELMVVAQKTAGGVDFRRTISVPDQPELSVQRGLTGGDIAIILLQEPDVVARLRLIGGGKTLDPLQVLVVDRPFGNRSILQAQVNGDRADFQAKVREGMVFDVVVDSRRQLTGRIDVG